MCITEINVACVPLLGVFFKLSVSLDWSEVYTKYVLSRGSQLRQFVHIIKGSIPQRQFLTVYLYFLQLLSEGAQD